MDVVVGDEEGGVGGGEDDYFWRWGAGAVDGGGEGGDEAGEVGGEFGVPEVEGGVVHGGADDGGGKVGGGYGAVAWGCAVGEGGCWDCDCDWDCVGGEGEEEGGECEVLVGVHGELHLLPGESG